MDNRNNTSRRWNTTASQSDSEQEHALKKQLEDIGVYDEGMTLVQMQKLLKFIKNEDKETPNLDLDNPGSQSESNDTLPKTLTECNSQYSELSSSTSPIPVNRTYSRESTSATNMSYAAKVNQSLTEDRASILFAETFGDHNEVIPPINTYALSPSPDRIGNPTSRRTLNSQENKGSIELPSDNEVEKYLLNPLDCKPVENDVPLKSRRFPVQRHKFSTTTAGTPIIPKDLLLEKQAFLTEQAELWWSYKNTTHCDDFRWGSPIKVNMASEDREPIKVEQSIEIAQSRPETSLLPVSATRKTGNSGYSLRVAPKKLDIYDFEVDDSDDDFDIIDKPKKQTKTPRRPAILKQSPGNQTKKKPNQKFKAAKDSSQSTLSDFIDDTDAQTSTTKSRKRPPTPDYPEETVCRTKKIATTNRTRTLGPRNRMPLAITRSLQSDINGKKAETPGKTSSLSVNEIEDALLTDDEDEPPLIQSTPQRPTDRLNMALTLLDESKRMDENKKRQHEEEMESLIRKKNREKDEKLMRRIKEENVKQEEKLMQEMKNKEKEEQYRSYTIGTRNSSKRFAKRTELESDDFDKGTVLLDTTKDESNAENGIVEETIVSRDHQCPICSEYFTEDEIDNHASNCFNYTNTEEEINENVTLHDKLCCVCKVFTTKNQQQMNEHMRKCVDSLTSVVEDPAMEATSSEPSQVNSTLNNNNHSPLKEEHTKRNSLNRSQNRKRKH